MFVERYQSNPIFSYAFIKKSLSGFVIITIYVDDLNVIEIREELSKAIKYPKKEFEMKDLEKNKILPWVIN